MTVESRFAEISLEMTARLDAAVGEIAELIVQDAKQRVPVRTGRLQKAIQKQHGKRGEWAVIAGNEKAWYGHIVEFGGVHTRSPEESAHRPHVAGYQKESRTGAHPFLIPAAEAHRAEAEALSREAVRNL